MDFITLSCPSCGGKLQITPDIDRFACSFCGHEHIVKRSGGIVSLSPVVAAIEGVKSGVDKTAAELALVRLEKEIKEWEAYESRLYEDPDKINGKVKNSLFYLSASGLLFFIFLLVSDSGSGRMMICAFALILVTGAPLVLMLVKSEKRNKKLSQELPRIDHEIKKREIEMHRLRELLKY